MNLLTISRFARHISSEHSYTHSMDDPTTSEAGALAELGQRDAIGDAQAGLADRALGGAPDRGAAR